ncbi:methyltransferase [Sphingosinicella sp. LY1275]|uniref:methyltransferase n=1 Tax=Sphingosinicella sp. LY1275 TaxID=3095379 RepID=UPI002ADEBB89|nr:methyltransferase [Sphingosinicella sp. LY1275]MEA1014091.1 methyltransferase [Sphingosinicella sp. LY1275]
MHLVSGAEPALLDLLAALDRAGYDFVAPTPATHARVLARPGKAVANDLRDIFGWSLPFRPALLPAEMLGCLERAGLASREGDLLKSGVRASRIGSHLFLHSAYPTDDAESVFLGPDSYRFVDFIRSEIPRTAGVRRLVDIGAGAGVGGIMAAALLPGARITLVDVNPAALRLASVNARHAGVDVELLEGEGIGAVSGPIDLAIANPPFIMDEDGRTYRDGGDMHGARLSLDWTLAAARRLEPGGRMLLYTGVAIVDGKDELRTALERELPALGCTLRYRELDPDIFGEELDRPSYRDVERIAAVSAVVEAAR